VVPSQPVVPLVVVVAGTEALTDRCREACDRWGVLAVPCDVRSAREITKRWRPLALVFLDDVLAFDRDGFTDLAREVGAGVVALPTDDVPLTVMRDALEPALRRRRR
jgi:hypothetical protein